MSKVIFTNSDGTVSIMTPIEGTAEECAKRDLPDGTSYEIVDDSVIPTDRSFRNAWKQNGKTIETDMTKARELAELGNAVSVHDNRIDLDRKIQVPGLIASADIQVFTLDSSEATTIASNEGLLNALIFGG